MLFRSRKSIIEWYKIKKPRQALAQGLFYNEEEIAEWLWKLNEIKFVIFEPLTLAVFIDKSNTSLSVLTYLKTIENFRFKISFVSINSGDIEQKYAYDTAKELLSGSIKLHSVIERIRNDCEKYFRIEKFKER